jgi:hypothetical protein
MNMPDGYRGWDLWMQGGRVGSHIIHHWPDNALKVVANKPIPVNKWVHITLTYDGSRKASGIAVYYDGQPQPVAVEADHLTKTTRTSVPLAIGQRNQGDRVNNLAVQDVRVFGRAVSSRDAAQLAKASRVAAILAKGEKDRSPAERDELYNWWLAEQDGPYRELAGRAEALRKEDADIRARGTIAHVMQEASRPATAYILHRGEYDQRRDQVTPGTPRVLPPFPADAPKNRLGFAQWLLQPDHPLTARVTVNRFWQELYGQGLVRTAGDFGIAGELPSHPELLDWLAVEFRESGWDVRRMFKLLVGSATYRQAAVITPEKREKDPFNRLLSRGPRFRMDAEMIRDSALAASGLLVRKVGGPSVKPYQPEGVWEAVAMTGSNTRDYKRDSGENLYRRSLYTFWKRAAPPASMDILNAPNRETCTVRRERTNTPLQALVTLNDPQFVEAARNLAEKALKLELTDSATVDWIALRLLARPLTADEHTIVARSLDALLTRYRAAPADATRLLEVGESKRDGKLDPVQHAAWTMLCNQLMNLDEALCK